MPVGLPKVHLGAVQAAITHQFCVLRVMAARGILCILIPPEPKLETELLGRLWVIHGSHRRAVAGTRGSSAVPHVREH